MVLFLVNYLAVFLLRNKSGFFERLLCFQGFPLAPGHEENPKSDLFSFFNGSRSSSHLRRFLHIVDH